jgi:trk system potassium uptake protein TrkH
MTLLRGRRFGDRRVRVERVKPQAFEIRPPRRLRPPPSPSAILVSGFAVLIGIGTVILMLPPMAASGTWTDPVTAFFTATSAVCVTGLVVVDTAGHWSPAGELAILLLIQLGGFGFMTGSTLLLFLLVRRRTGLRDRVLVQESIGVPQLGDVVAVLRRVAVFTALAEIVGAVVLVLAFATVGRVSDLGSAAWWGVFHSISAFNNAGFDLTGGFQGFAPFAGEALVLVPVAVLILLGSLGFAIVADAFGKRRWGTLALETKLVLVTSAVLTVLGASLVLVLEWSNPRTLGSLPVPERLLGAAFESVSLRTAGFSTMEVAACRDATLVIVMALMFIGGAPGSTAGGIKVTTFSALGIAIVSSIRGRPAAEAFGRRLPHVLVYRAIAVALLSIGFVFLVSLVLVLTSEARFLDLVFEAISAFGTNGTSPGTTRTLDQLGLIVTAIAMFVGRLGPLTLALALAARTRAVNYRPAVESIRIG